MKKYDTNAFILNANKAHNFKYDYSKSIYTGANIKIEIICKEHGSFWQNPSKHVNYNNGCPKCNNKTRKISQPKSLENFIKEANKIHNFKYDYSKSVYINCRTPLEIICKEHGSFFQTPRTHLYIGNKKYLSGCFKCFVKRNQLTLEQFIKKSRATHGDYFDYSKVELNGVKNKIIIICPIHGEFKQKAENHFINGCPKCAFFFNTSKMEREWLDGLGLPDTSEYRNVAIKVNGRKFNVDGCIPGSNIIYEFLGDFWHGHPVKFNTNDINALNKTKFGELFTKTVEKIKFLRSNGFKVISIWENNFK